MMFARAYVYAGDWVGDCPLPDCYNAEFLLNPVDPRRPTGPGNPRIDPKPVYRCSNCGNLAGIEWPEPQVREEIEHVLAQRPVPSTRNWYPAAHPLAVAARIPHGQSPDDLRLENFDHGITVG